MPRTRSNAKNALVAPPAAVQWTPEQLSLTLGSLIDPNCIQQGETALKPFLKHPGCIPQLLTQVTQNPDKNVRHQASLLIRKKVSKFYIHYTVPEQNHIKTTILQCLTTEPERNVAQAIAGCVTELASCVFGNKSATKSWDELFQSLITLSQDQNPTLRSTNFLLIEHLMEDQTVAEFMRPHLQTLSALVAGGFNDNDIKVKQQAMIAFVALVISNVERDEVMQLESLIPQLLSTMSICLENDEQETVAQALEVIQECATTKQPLINNHLDIIIPLLVRIIENTSAEYDSVLTRSAT